ncbi:pyridoxal-phosphate dependent enzyme [Gulosibacter macacae]|uniref:Pyridoxal-phosphate dependent enzyme n=1 Tax=Gulosibacter macacae TaxID=2488791 RepID=A0A3P3W0M7_9MICO|nr:pyridoxal-phosphate dependent enzyme [Gulosibacter macacae]RRJ88612.1 pyridoxal-phosphate dependent enzyme [Gulosibacter macacae]
MRIAASITELIGNTPLVELHSLPREGGARVVAKVEYLNPGGSVKDRIAERILDAAEAAGQLHPGGTIVEPTSGNTGVGLALAAQHRGYRCIFVVPDKVGDEKIRVLRAYGAEVVINPAAVATDDPRSYNSVAARLVAETPGAFMPNQFDNANGPAAHYDTTGPEIWRDTEGTVTHVVIGVGTGGTVTGTGRYLHDVSNGAVEVVGVEPVGSIYGGGEAHPYLVEGVGEDFFPPTYDSQVPDRIVKVTDADAFATTRCLAAEEGLLVGGSSGMAAAAALELAATLSPDDLVVVILPDGGRGYLNKIFDDNWMHASGFDTTHDTATNTDRA